MIVEFVDANREDFGVEPICTVLQVAPSTYYAVKSRPPSARAVRDAELKDALLALWTDNYCVYGVRKLHKAARRAGHRIGRDQTARLMRSLGIAGARRDKKVRTTKADDKAARHPDLVERRFAAERPNQLWVTDLTYVATWAGMVYVCFIVDVFSRSIVGWRVATNMRTEMVLDALEMARWSRGTRLEGLVCHSDAGSQGEFNRSSQHLMITEVCDGTTATASGSGPSTGDALAGEAAPGEACGARVLASDRQGHTHRRSSNQDRRVRPGRVPLVSSRWRHAAVEPGRSDRPLLVVR